MKKLFATGALLAGIVTQASAAFTGAFAPANWAQFPGDGSINSFTSGGLSITSGDAGSGSFTDVAILIQQNGVISFDWDFSTQDDPAYEFFGVTTLTPAYLFTQVSDSTPGGPQSQSGTFSLFVNAGDFFSFTAWSLDGTGGPATTRIGNFGFASIPEPGTLALLAVALAAATTMRRRQV